MLPIYKMILTEETEGMDYISLVSQPAHYKQFEFFNGKSEQVKYHFNEDKRITEEMINLESITLYSQRKILMRLLRRCLKEVILIT